MNAEQYRALVNKLESIQEAATDADSLAMAQASAGLQTGTTTGSVPAGDNSEVLKQIEHAPTFKQAYAMATKAGLKKFKWCQCKDYLVKDAPKIKPIPKPSPKFPTGMTATPDNTFVTTNPMGDADPTQFSGNPALRGR